MASPNRGATVRSYDLPDLEDMYELRALLEGNAARRAATRIGTDALQMLHESCVRFEKLVGGSDVDQLVAENAHFHGTILDAADSERLQGWCAGDSHAADLQVVHLVLSRTGNGLLPLSPAAHERARAP